MLCLFSIHYPRIKDACLVDKGPEWKTMHAPSLVDSGIPSELNTGGSGELEEEGSLPAVAMTRAKDERRPDAVSMNPPSKPPNPP